MMANPKGSPKPIRKNRTPPDEGGLGQVLAAMPVMVSRISREGRYLGYEAAKGLEPYAPPGECTGRLLHDVLPLAIAAGAMSCIETALATGAPQTYVYELTLGDDMHRFEMCMVALSPEEVLAVVRDVTMSDRPTETYGLTPTELAVLSCVALGLADKEIASNRRISAETVHKHVASIRQKMGARSRTEAAVRAVREGILG